MLHNFMFRDFHGMIQNQIDGLNRNREREGWGRYSLKTLWVNVSAKYKRHIQIVQNIDRFIANNLFRKEMSGISQKVWEAKNNILQCCRRARKLLNKIALIILVFFSDICFIETDVLSTCAKLFIVFDWNNALLSKTRFLNSVTILSSPFF